MKKSPSQDSLRAGCEFLACCCYMLHEYLKRCTIFVVPAMLAVRSGRPPLGNMIPRSVCLGFFFPPSCSISQILAGPHLRLPPCAHSSSPCQKTSAYEPCTATCLATLPLLVPTASAPLLPLRRRHTREQNRGGLLKQQLEVRPRSDGRPGQEIVPLSSELSFEKGFFVLARPAAAQEPPRWLLLLPA